MNAELYSFIRESLAKGVTREEIASALRQANWQEEDVRKGLASFADVPFPVPVPRPRPNLQAREAFLYLVSFITLYISAFAFGTLIFSFIDEAFPSPGFMGGRATGAITTALAAIIVAFPIYLILTWRLAKAAAVDPERRSSLIRKWLTYLTLVIAAGIIIGDLIATLASLLQGDLTVRFTLKALTILAITGSIFGYYLWDLRQDEEEQA